MRDDRTGSVDAEVELLPTTLALPTVFRGRPLAFANDREPSAVDDEVDGFARWDSPKRNFQVLAAPRERSVIRDLEIDLHHPEERVQKVFGLTQR